MSKRFLTFEHDHVLPLDGTDRLPPSVHVFSSAETRAVNAALATGRALLVRGEPGVGKSQLARAAAAALGRGFVHQAVDGLTEPHDLLWTFDAVGRLAEAQVASRREAADAHAAVEFDRFVQPGALWWALDPKGAAEQAALGGAGACFVADPSKAAGGVVALVDEIDKADPSVPNALLDALGHRGFDVRGRRRVSAADGVPPLVVITTNEERALPDAFLRRCLVLVIALPEEEAALRAHLVARGAAHEPQLAVEVREEAATLVVNERRRIQARGLTAPGVAEYLDLLRAVQELADGPGEQRRLLGEVATFILDKHPAERA